MQPRHGRTTQKYDGRTSVVMPTFMPQRITVKKKQKKKESHGGFFETYESFRLEKGSVGQRVLVCGGLGLLGCGGGDFYTESRERSGHEEERESKIGWKNAIMHPGPLQLLVVCFSPSSYFSSTSH